MTRDQLQACTRAALRAMARRQGILGWHGMRKDQLILALEAPPARPRKRAASGHPNGARPASPAPALPASPSRKLLAPVQKAAARDTSGSPEELVESSK